MYWLDGEGSWIILFGLACLMVVGFLVALVAANM